MTKSTITRERLEEIVSDPMINQGSEFAMMARMALAAMGSEPDCNERNLFCSTDTARMRKVISVSAGSGATPLYRHSQPAPVVPEIDRQAIADKVYGKCCRIPGATFYNAAEFAIDEVEAWQAAMLAAARRR